MGLKTGLWLSILSLILLVGANTTYGQDDLFELSDEELFNAEDQIMVEATNLIDEGAFSNIEGPSVSFSGRLFNQTTYYMQREWLEGTQSGDTNRFSSQLEGHIMLDIRLLKDFRGFVNLGVAYNPSGIPQVEKQYIVLLGTNTNQLSLFDLNTRMVLKEMFLDLNIQHLIYFRLGKQVLQWGQGYFWNPSDLINSERKTFQQMDKYREGTFGLKLHIPYKTIFNFYGFLDATEVEKFTDFAVAGKLEFLIAGVQFSFSGWAKKDFYPVYGFDFTARFLGIDWRGELSLSQGDNHQKLGEAVIIGPFTNYTLTQNHTDLIPRISLGFTKSFDWEIDDRITLSGEFFYNHSGYYENVFSDKLKTQFLIYNNLYEPNYHSVYYGAMFFSLRKFFISDLTFNLNAIGNFNDWSFMVIGGVSYIPVFDLTLGLNIYGFVGNPDGEYTWNGNALGLEMTASIVF